MKKGLVRFLLLFAAFSMVCAPAALAAGKIGYFDMQAVLKGSKVAQQAEDEIKRQGESLKGPLDAKSNAFKTAKEDFDKKKDVMDDKAKAKKAKELQDMLVEGEKLQQEAQAKINKMIVEKRGPIVERVMEIINKIGKDDNYDFIFERGTTLVYANEKEDLTKRIIQELDKAGPKKK
ncbi:MAG: OmpH family outer membrane protein [Deltaproteobacteria bacterium]|nr:OmpH family outer membrane protein [Deltaproteobacteria bacterium]